MARLIVWLWLATQCAAWAIVATVKGWPGTAIPSAVLSLFWLVVSLGQATEYDQKTQQHRDLEQRALRK